MSQNKLVIVMYLILEMFVVHALKGEYVRYGQN